MAYEVTKHIKGRDYRYRVAGTRWTYLGKLEDGELVAPARSVPRRVTHPEIVAVTAKLLESRDASRVTVAVIAHHAGISPGTFYRQFSDRDAAFAEALTALCEQCVEELPPLAPPIGAPAAERRRLFDWFEALHQTVLRRRALRWFLTTAGQDALPSAPLAGYFRALEAAGLATIGDAEALAAAVIRVYVAVMGGTSHWSEAFPVIERAVFA